MKLWQLIQEENSMMGETDLAGGDVGGSPEEADVGDGVVGIAEGAPEHDRLIR